MRNPDRLVPGPLSWLTLGGAAALLSWCAAAGPQLYDAGELAVAAFELGGSHPPGQPLPSLIGHVFCWLPLGPIALRLSLLSVVCALGAALSGASLCAELCAQLGIEGRLRAACEALAVLCIVLAPPVLRQALRIEVYTLALWLFMLGALQLFRWGRDARARQLWSAAALAGFAACVHPPHALAIALTGACVGALQPRRLLASPRVLAGSLCFGLLPLLTLCYLPIRARAGAPMWGDPTTWRGFFSYVSSQAFLGNIAKHDRLTLLRDYAAYIVELTAGLPLIGALLLLWKGRSRGQPAVVGLMLAAASALMAVCLQPLEARNPDNVAYLAPALSLLLVLGLVGFASLGLHGARVVAVIGLVLMAVPRVGAQALREMLRADVPALEALGAELLERPPARALVVGTTDFVVATWMMAQSLEGARPDAAIFAAGLASSSWQWKRLARHPALATRPLRAPGRDARDQYTRGAIAFALPRVPVLLESERAGLPAAAPSGAYVLLEPREVEDRQQVSDLRRMQGLARDAALSPAGDSGAAAAVIRNVFYQRSLRTFRAGRVREALQYAALGLWELPAPERALVQVERDRASEALPLLHDDPSSYLISSEDALRLAAAELWSVGERDRALELLRAEQARGDLQALIQLSYLHAASGAAGPALSALGAFEATGQALPDRARRLRAALQQPGPLEPIPTPAFRDSNLFMR